MHFCGIGLKTFFIAVGTVRPRCHMPFTEESFTLTQLANISVSPTLRPVFVVFPLVLYSTFIYFVLVFRRPRVCIAAIKLIMVLLIIGLETESAVKARNYYQAALGV